MVIFYSQQVATQGLSVQRLRLPSNEQAHDPFLDAKKRVGDAGRRIGGLSRELFGVFARIEHGVGPDDDIGGRVDRAARIV